MHDSWMKEFHSESMLFQGAREHDSVCSQACGWCYLAAINAPKIMVKTVSLMDVEKVFL